MPLAVLVAIADPAGQRLVAAMLAPGLGDRFQFDVGRIAAELAEMGLDRLHFDQRQIKLPLRLSRCRAASSIVRIGTVVRRKS